MSDHVVKCPAGASMHCVCTLCHHAVVMADPGMMHFTSLVQGTYMSLLFRSASNIHESEWFQWQEILSSFWCPSTKNTSDNPWALKCENEFESSLHLVLLGAISVYRNLFWFFLLWFLFPCSFFLIGCGKDFYWIGKCSMYTTNWFYSLHL